MIDFDSLRNGYETVDFNKLRESYTPTDFDKLRDNYSVEKTSPGANNVGQVDDTQLTTDEAAIASGKKTQKAINDFLSKLSATGAFVTTKAVQSAVHPLFAPLEGTPFDTNASIQYAVDYWRSKVPKGANVHDLAITVSDKPVKGELANIGPLRLLHTKYSARELAGDVASGIGFIAPVSQTMRAGGLLTEKFAARAPEAVKRIASGTIGGALLGEGDPKKTAKMAATFGLFEAVPALGKVIKDKAQRAKIMHEWRKVPAERRVPVVQTLQEALDNNPGLSEADAVRMSQEWFKEARSKRTEPESTKEVKETEKVSFDEMRANYEAPASENRKSAVSGDATTVTPDSGSYAFNRAEGDVFSNDVPLVDLPEIVELANAITSGKVQLRKKFRKAGTTAHFAPDYNLIRLRYDLANNPEDAIKILAHEIGHAVDYADETMKRGNVLGRIGKLRGYIEKYLAEKPGAPGPLTKEEIRALREEAEKIAKNEIDAAIEEEIGFTPEEVLNYLRGVKPDTLDQSVRDYIAKASTAEKKSIVKQAMKGLTPDELKHIKKAQSTGEPTKKTINEKFNELLKKEVKRRKLWELSEINNELNNFTAYWRPWKKGVDTSFDAYRTSAPEKYADAVSALIVNPEALQKHAPKFMQAFNNYIDERPEFRDAWNAIQERLQDSDAISKHRLRRTEEDFAQQHEKLRELEKARVQDILDSEEKLKDTLMRGLNDKAHPVLRIIRLAENIDGPLGEAAKKLRGLYKKRPYIPSEIDAYAYDFGKWYEKVQNSGFSIDELGTVGKRLHIIHNRKGIFSTHGLYEKPAQQDLDFLRKEWGDERYNKALELLDEYRRLREKRIIPVVEESGLAGDALLEAMWERKHYLRVLDADWLKGNKWPGIKHYYRQIGNLGNQANPIVSTFLDDIGAIYSARENILKRETIRFLADAGIARPAKLRYSTDKKTHVPVERQTGKNEDIVSFKHEGRTRYYVVPQNVAELLRTDPHKTYQIERIWQAFGQVFRELFVSSNPQWMLRNIPRDFLETIIRNPHEIGLRGMAGLLKSYWETAPEVWKEAWKGERSALIQDMMRRKSLTTNRIWGGFDETPQNEIERTLSRFNFYQLSKKERKVYSRFIKHFFDNQTVEQIIDTLEGLIRSAWEKKERVGRMSDMWGKVAGRRFLEKYTDLSPDEIDQRVIESIGTPDWKTQGNWQKITNNIFIFSTVGKEGLKSEIKAAIRHPWAWIKVVVTLSVVPTILNFVAEQGYLGKGMRNIMRRVPKYYKDHYFVIPLFIDENGKAHFLAFPTGFNQQVIKAFFAKALRGEFSGKEGAISELTNINPYNVHPAIGVVSALSAYYLLGINPISLYTGKNVIPQADFEAGGAAAQKDLWRYVWNTLGGKLVYQFPSPYMSQKTSAFERSLHTWPGKLLGTFYKISDAGLGEMIQDRLRGMRKEAKQRQVAMSDMLLKTAKNKDKALIIAKVLQKTGDTRTAKRLLKDVKILWGDQWAKALATAKNEEEKKVILQMMLEDD